MSIVVRLLLIFPLLWADLSMATVCPQQNYTIKSFADGDALSETGCTIVTGSVTVSLITVVLGDSTDGWEKPDEIDTSALRNLQEIGGDLYIKAPLTPLPNLRYVGGNLTIGYYPDSPIDLSHLPHLRTVGGTLYLRSDVTNSASLKLDTLGGLFLQGDLGELDLSGLDGIKSIIGSIVLQDRSFGSFGCVQRGPTSIKGLTELEVVGGDIDIFCSRMRDLEFLSSVNSLGGNLSVTDNSWYPTLDCSALSGLLNYPFGPPGDGVAGEIYLERNGSDCNSVSDIFNYIAGLTYAFVERFYTLILGRVGSDSEIKNWIGLMDAESSGRVALAFLTSQEFKNRELTDFAFLDVLYRSLFDREGDAEGVAAWMEQLSQGKLREMVVYGFLKSAEFKVLSNRFNTVAFNAADESAYGIRAFVERFYNLVLGRQPDRGGFDGWVTALSAKTLSGGDLAKAFFLSAEYEAKNTTDSDFVETAYQAFFGRAADAAGKQGWLDVLSGGESREYVLNGFIGSAEFTALAASYGINASRDTGALGRPDGGIAAERRTQKVGDAEAIPALPMVALFMLSGLLGLFGIRRLMC